MLYLIAAVVGSLLGIIGSRILFVGSSLSLIPWAIAGLILGWFAESKKQSLLIGSTYGFFLTVVFMIAGYNGQRPLIQVLPFFVGLGLFGAFCGCILSILGATAKKFLKR